MTSTRWETLQEIAARTGYPPEIVVARVRDEHVTRKCVCRFMSPDRTEWRAKETAKLTLEAGL